MSPLEELVQQLLNDGKGDAGRLEHILSTIKKGHSLYVSDSEYIEKLLAGLRNTENIKQPNENPKESKSEDTDSKDTTKSEIHSEHSTSEQPTEIEILRKEVHKLQDKNHVIEEHLRNQVNQKMRKGNAIGGVILMAIGIIMVVGGGAGAIDSMCIGQAYGTCRSDMMALIGGVVIFWIGMIPTIFGVRLIAKA